MLQFWTQTFIFVAPYFFKKRVLMKSSNILKCLICTNRRFLFLLYPTDLKKKADQIHLWPRYILYIYCKVIDKNLIFICFYIKDFFSRSIWVIPTASNHFHIHSLLLLYTRAPFSLFTGNIIKCVDSQSRIFWNS